MSIGTKLVAVMEACRFMPQDGYNTFQKYKYTTAAGMFAKINEAFASQGLFTQAEMTLLELREVTSAKGSVDKHAAVSAKIIVTDSETGETVTFTGLGSGQDAGDKSIMKAQTAALKYAYIGGLCIAMSDDPEADSPQQNGYQQNGYQQPPTKTPLNNNSWVTNNSKYAPAGKCDVCGRPITQKVLDYSMNKYGKALCMEHQKQAQNQAEEDVPFD